MKSIFPALLFIVMVWPLPADAQVSKEERLQLRAIAGWAAFGDGDVHHRVVGVATDVRLWAGLRLGPEVLYNIGPGRDRDISVMPIVSYDFRRLQRVVPFVSAGYGILRHTDGGRSSHSVTFGLGGGAKIAISERLFVSPEVRVGWEPWTRAMVSLGYRF